MPAVRSSGSAQEGCRCLAILNKGERIFPNTADIYIYIYNMKADKGVAEIKYRFPMFACEGKL